jgi:hypothetical protein
MYLVHGILPLALWPKTPEERPVAAGDNARSPLLELVATVGVLVLASSSEAGVLWEPGFSLCRAFLRADMASLYCAAKLYQLWGETTATRQSNTWEADRA